MDRGMTSRKAKICKFLACGCKRVCSCSYMRSADDEHEDHSKQYPSGADSWSPNPVCKPWTHSHMYCRPVAGSCSYNDGKSIFPTQSRRIHHNEISAMPRTPILPPSHTMVGHPSLQIYRCRLPHHLLHLLDKIVDGCHNHAATLSTGWMTYLYSLTKQDIALRDIPGMYETSKPIIHYIKKFMERVYEVSTVRIDRNQPHVLKYSAEDGSKHTGVELHHDKCDFTANLMMSRSNTYVGGGTYFPDANATVRLEFGEFLIHPGNLVHGGVDISRGSRYLMILFTHTE